MNMSFAITMSALGLLLLVGAQGTTIISIKYPPQNEAVQERMQPAKRDLSLSYAATNIDSKEGTRVKTITVIKNVGGNVGGEATQSLASGKQVKLAINPELHKNEDWANAFRDNFDSYGILPDVPDIDDLFDFVNRKQPSKVIENEAKEQKHAAVETTTTTPPTTTTTAKAVSEHVEAAEDSDEATVEKIKGDAELLPHIKEVNILRLQALEQQKQQQQQQQQQQAQDQAHTLRMRESLVNVNYSTPMHSVSQFFENYVQVLPNGYDYAKPQQPCAVAAPPNSIQVTTPSGRTYDIPQSNSSGTNGGAKHPYLAPALAKRTQIQPAPSGQPQAQQPPNYSSVNSLVPPIVQPAQGIQPANVPQLPAPQPTPSLVAAVVVGGGGGAGVSTSQRPYVAPSLRNNGLGINRGPQPQLPPLQSGYIPPSFQTNNVFGVGGTKRPNIFRSRGLKY